VKNRANFERRQRSIEARLDPRWQPERAEPVLEGGNIAYEVSGRTEAISGGGLGMLQALVDVVGLREQIDGSLHLFRRHMPYHESDHVLALVYNCYRSSESVEIRSFCRRSRR
jgi:hypothetical protein